MKNYQSNIFIILTAVLTVSCAGGGNYTSIELTKNSKYSTESVSIPKLNITTKTELGETLLVRGVLETYDGIRINKRIEHTGDSKKIILPAGLLLKNIGEAKTKTIKAVGKVVGGTVYESDNIDIVMNSTGKSHKQKGGVLISDDRNISNALWLQYGGSNGHRLSKEAYSIKQNIDYKKQEVQEWLPNEFRQEMVYNGISGKKAQFIYREFMDGMIRDKFTQHISYDFKKGSIIGFKGARFKIIKANNVEIEYEVLKYFK